ncbi:NAD(P)H-dependent oxidoreductase [Novosphingobium sp. G106]|uniref:NAD(P)H-dependent oxidoreductase n=1 Tax=Novosphingobium sp. G106 TaxID=2849500 RepID=UPI001C2CE8AB|nr:NAD(P)H-dependent oxidoreductase [Novosphingobium sp. G106]MBV1691924.1 NAD(P)H-dependent oxidoreductase [Novosphingobium sp. G106]
MEPPQAVKQLVVLAHPSAQSFCSSIARRWQERAERNHQICELRDLYRDGFDPVLRATEQPGKIGFAPSADNVAECRRLQDTEVLVFVYPVWFGSPPAILKGYFERVVGCGTAFKEGEQAAKALANVRVVQIATSASSEPWLAEKGVKGALHTLYDQYIAEVFGAKEVLRLHLGMILEAMDSHYAASQLSRVDEFADRVCAAANAERWERAASGLGLRNPTLR